MMVNVAICKRNNKREKILCILKSLIKCRKIEEKIDMEELKIIRDLNKTIKEEYILDNAYEFSMALVNAGYTEISDDIREKILF